MTRLSEQAPVAAVLEKFPGAEIVDVRQPAQEDEAALPKAGGKGKSLKVLAALVEAEALRIRTRQDALVETGDRETPHAAAEYRAECFDAIARILKCCGSDPVIIDQLRKAAS